MPRTNLNFLVEEFHQGVGVKQGLGLLEQEALVSRTSALRDEQELVFVARRCVELDLARQVRSGVLLLVHVECRHLVGEAITN